ncbi:lysophosphatidylcholine acyltransferase 2-like isoform X2 [Artemia franciscana]|uniref:EF-hand domain-containing protein n=1 Tax=Artemia franciscana TaxID=6661 RepID=A0AA88I675_ARTSF|nr:hypothetical protein QYM36_004773 [Artemia franciscana]
MEGPVVRRTIKRNEDVTLDQSQPQTNPFTHSISLSTYDKIKIFVLSIVLLLPRVIGVAICLVTSYWLACIGLLGLSEEELKSKPMQGWRRCFATGINFCGRLAFRIIGYRVRIKGRIATRSEAPILVIGPHSTFADALVIYWIQLPHLISRVESKLTPFLGKLINFTQPIYVEREDPNSRANTIKEMVRRATSEDPWQQILIFPEGTCSNRKALITFKPGAFYPGVAVQPVCIKYPNRLDTLSWTWDGPGAMKILWYTMTQFVTYAEIEFLPPYVPSEEEIRDPKIFAENVRLEMAKCLEVPVVNYSFEDCRLMLKATKLGLPSEVGLIGAANLKTKYGFDQKELETTILESFAKIADKKDGVIRQEGLASYLEIPVNNPCLMQVFKAYDQDCKGFISFKKFIVGRMSVSLPAITEQNLEATFELLDRGKKGYINLEDVTYALEKSFAGSTSSLKLPLFGVKEDSKITYGDFASTVNEKPEYAKFFEIFRQSYAPAS